MVAGRKIRVMIVEDSPTMRLLLEQIIGADRRLEVAASVGSAEEALRLLPAVRPDVISLDIRLPGMNGLEATRHIMADQPTPIVVVSASVEAEDLKISMNALSAGALTVVEKPAGLAHADHSALVDRLCRQLVLMSDVPVIRQRRAPSPPRATKTPTGAAPSPAMPWSGSYEALGIVASTGGPNAIVTLLRALGSDYPLPILVVQHITSSFLAGFAAWLEDMGSFKVVIANDETVPLPGHVYLPAEDRHMELCGRRLRVTDGAPVCNQKPSGTVLFRSLAQSLGSRALAVLLTGMGDDGAEGLRAVRDAGGYTIAEDASTAVVYGMPAVAARLGAAVEQLPLWGIGARLREISQLSRVAV